MRIDNPHETPVANDDSKNVRIDNPHETPVANDDKPRSAGDEDGFSQSVQRKIDFGVKMDDDRVLYKQALESVQRGDESAKTDLAWFMLSGCGGAEVNVDAAVTLLEERVRNKDEEAMWMLGLCLEYGRGIKKDIKKAEELYRTAAKS